MLFMFDAGFVVAFSLRTTLSSNFRVVSREWTGCFGQSSVFTNDEQWA
jgi:hypothetical protein